MNTTRRTGLLLSLSEKLDNELERHAELFIWERPYLREKLEDDFEPIEDVEKEKSINNLRIKVLKDEILKIVRS